MTQSIKLSMVPSGVPSVLHFSQGDGATVGENLVLNYAKEVSVTGYTAGRWGITQKLTDKKDNPDTYTITLDYTPGDANMTNFDLYCNGGIGGPTVQFKPNGIDRQTVSATFAHYDSASKNYITFYRFPYYGTVIETTTVHRIKIEHGSTATAFCPALSEQTDSVARKIEIEVTDAPESWGGITGTIETDAGECNCTLQSATNTFTCILPTSITSHAGMHRAQLALHNGTAVIRSAVFLIDIEQGAKTQ